MCMSCFSMIFFGVCICLCYSLTGITVSEHSSLRYTPPLSITKTLLIVPTKNERDPPLFTGKLLIKFQNILRNTTQVIIQQGKNPIFRHIKSNNSGTAKVKIVKIERDPPLFTGKLFIKFQNILRNATQDIIRHRVKILFSVISSPITLERQK